MFLSESLCLLHQCLKVSVEGEGVLEVIKHLVDPCLDLILAQGGGDVERVQALSETDRASLEVMARRLCEAPSVVGDLTTSTIALVAEVGVVSVELGCDLGSLGLVEIGSPLEVSELVVVVVVCHGGCERCAADSPSTLGDVGEGGTIS